MPLTQNLSGFWGLSLTRPLAKFLYKLANKNRETNCSVGIKKVVHPTPEFH